MLRQPSALFLQRGCFVSCVGLRLCHGSTCTGPSHRQRVSHSSTCQTPWPSHRFRCCEVWDPDGTYRENAECYHDNSIVASNTSVWHEKVSAHGGKRWALEGGAVGAKPVAWHSFLRAAPSVITSRREQYGTGRRLGGLVPQLHPHTLCTPPWDVHTSTATAK